MALSVALASLGCGGGMPLWYGPAPVKRGDTHFGAGLSSTFLVGGTASSIQRAQGIEANGGAPSASPNGPTGGSEAFTPGALAAAAASPGIAPGVTARVGLGAQIEAGLLYTGRSARLDLRRSFDLRHGRHASFGVGAYTHLYGQPASNNLPSVAVQNVRGYGADVPALIGIVREDGTLGVWGGLRAGGEWIKLARVTSEPKDVTFGATPVELEATRFYAGPTVGGTVGYKMFHLVAELMLSFETIQGRYANIEGSVRGLGITPSTALVFDF